MLAAAIAVPMLMLGGAGVWYSYDIARSQQTEMLLGRAKAMASLVDRELLSAEAALRVLGASRTLAAGDLPAIDRQLRTVANNLGGAMVSLMRPDGMLVLNTDWPEGEMREVPASQFAFQAAHSRGPRISDFVALADGSLGRVGAGMPVRVGGSAEPWGLVLYLPAGLLGEDLRSLDLPESWEASIADRNGIVVARSRQQQERLGKPVTPELRKAMAGSDEGILPASHRTLEGTPAVTAFATSAIGYRAAIGIPYSEFTAPLRDALLRSALPALAVAGFGIVGALLLAGRIAGPLRRLARDPFSQAEPSHIAEVDELARALRRADASRRDSEEKLRDLMETLDLATAFARDLDGTIRFWPKGCERLYGWPAAVAVGSNAHALLHTRFPVPQAEVQATLIEKGEWEGDLVHRRRDGSTIIVAVRKVLRRNAEGAPASVLETVADVTALRAAQAELERLNADLEERVRAEVAAREEAQRRAAHAERMQALGQLAGGIAHDFNNVLQAVTGGAGMIERRPGNAETVRRFARLVSEAASRGSAITRRLLSFARRGDLRADAIDPADLLHGLQEILASTLGSNVNVVLDIAPGLRPVLADRGQLETVLVNLAGNARDAMPQGGTLTLGAALAAGPPPRGLRTEEGYLVLTVRDTGTGMPPEVMARAAEPFFTTKPRGEGTGLGLAMANGFAEQSGGALTIDSAPGRGTIVSIWLPLAANPAECAAPPAEKRPAAVNASVLLVDDDPLVRDGLGAQLADLGFDVSACENANDALDHLRAGGAVDALVTDLSMPGMDGLGLIREAQALRPRLPTILLTGYAGDGAALALGGVVSHSFTLLRKPVQGQQLADRIAALLEARERAG